MTAAMNTASRTSGSSFVEEFFNADTLLPLCYPHGAGGKFISNCLSISKQSLPMFPHAKRRHYYYLKLFHTIHRNMDRFAENQPEQVLERLQLSDNPHPDHTWKLLILRYLTIMNDPDSRLSWVMSTLPKSQDHIEDWQTLEFSPHETYGQQLHFKLENSHHFFENDYIEELVDSKFCTYWVCHDPRHISVLLENFPKCRPIRFTHSEKWIQFCASLNKNYHVYVFDEAPELPNNLEFNVDSLFDKNHFMDEIFKLYSGIGLEDFNEAQIFAFYSEYMAVHGIDVKSLA